MLAVVFGGIACATQSAAALGDDAIPSHCPQAFPADKATVVQSTQDSTLLTAASVRWLKAYTARPAGSAAVTTRRSLCKRYRGRQAIKSSLEGRIRSKASFS